MDHAEENPERNALPSGMTEQLLDGAVRTSGFPLQLIAGDVLRRHDFLVQDEWGYADRLTGETRTLDLYATRQLYEIADVNAYRVRPKVSLLVECKRSGLPYVFFGTERPWMPKFPRVAGLTSEEVTLTTDDDRSTWTMSAVHCLGLQDERFRAEPPTAATFSKVEWRKGSETVLSGADPYQRIVMPLISGLHHYLEAQRPASTYFYFDADLVLPLAVIDAPMVHVELDKGAPKYCLVPWVRVIRNEPTAVTESSGDEVACMDIIHVDFMDRYLRSHLLPFADAFMRRAQRHHQVLATGEGFARGLGQSSRSVEARLEPRRMTLPGPLVEVPSGLFPFMRSLLRLADDLVATGVANLRLRLSRRR